MVVLSQCGSINKHIDLQPEYEPIRNQTIQMTNHWWKWPPPHQLNFVPCKQHDLLTTLPHRTYINRRKTEQNTSPEVPLKMLTSLIMKPPGPKQHTQGTNCCQNSSMYLRISHLLFIAKQFPVFIHICLFKFDFQKLLISTLQVLHCWINSIRFLKKWKCLPSRPITQKLFCNAL